MLAELFESWLPFNFRLSCNFKFERFVRQTCLLAKRMHRHDVIGFMLITQLLPLERTANVKSSDITD